MMTYMYYMKHHIFSHFKYVRHHFFTIVKCPFVLISHDIYV